MEGEPAGDHCEVGADEDAGWTCVDSPSSCAALRPGSFSHLRCAHTDGRCHTALIAATLAALLRQPEICLPEADLTARQPGTRTMRLRSLLEMTNPAILMV